MHYLCATLGKRENKEDFIKKQTGKYQKFSKELENKEIIENEISELNEEINELFKLQNEIAKLKQILSEVKIEHEYFNKYEHNNVMYIPKIKRINKITSDVLMELKVEYEEQQKESLWFRMKSQLFYGIGNKEFYKESKENRTKYYNKLFFMLKEMELEDNIKRNNRRIKEIGSNKLDLLIDDSMKILQENLREKYKGRTERRKFDITDLYNNSTEVNKEYPIIFSTTYSIKNSLGEKHKYDYIIMDESSQVDLITGVLALSVAKNAVIVGDVKQLPNVITTEHKKLIEELSKRYKVGEEYNYLDHSFLSSISKAIPQVAKTLLKEHYRCHPKIIQFCNKKFYNNELVIMTEDKGENDVLKAYVTTEGNHARGHINQRQIDVIEKEIIPELSKKVDSKDIGIISPYKHQKNQMEKTFETDLKIDTVHKFQGREQDAIVLTTVDNEIGDFVDDPKMLNVAVTRAKKYLRLVVSNNEKNEGTNIGDLVKYIQYNNFEVVESKTKSIYDLLYKQNRQKRMEYLKNKKRISDYDSENITFNLIDSVLKKNNYTNLDIAVHIPIRNVLADMKLLDEDEFKFVNNVWSHIDFVVFNKMDKKLILAIEVDGYFYHREGSKQQQRDRLKDRILDKYDVPLIRFSTVGSGEEELLKAEIEKTFG